jgi:deazaflavin-dependent oxidoreductase (nitroreductase family)
MASWNDQVIADFRAQDGVMGPPWEGKTVLLLHAVGRKTGKVFVSPLVAAPDGDDFVICASMGGAPDDPQWVNNLEAASGPATIEIGARTVQAEATVVRPDDPEWSRLYGIWKAYWPGAAEYETKTDRRFPVAKLHILS